MPRKDPEAAKAYQRQRYKENKHLWKTPEGKWKRMDPAKRRVQRRERYRADPAFRAHLAALRRKYRKAKTVTGTCPICKRGPQLLVQDHCHKTGKQRGRICHHCNLVLGHARDNPKVLTRAAKYLQAKG